MSNTLKFGNGQWATKEGSTLAYNDENNNFKPLPFNFERGSSATIVNKDGLIETVGSDMPRIDYKDDSEGALLLEPQRTNILPYSSDFNSGWTQYGSPTINTSSIISPDGTLNGSNITRGINGTPLRYQSLTSTGTQYTFSLYAKKGSVDKIYLDIGDVADVEFTLTDEWQRFEITQTPTTFTHIDISFGTSTSGDNFYIFGAQLEEGSYATSLINTQGSTVTRLAEISVTQTPPSGIINSSEGVFYAEMSALSNDGANRYISLSNGSTSNRVVLRFNSSNEISGFVVSGTTQASFSYDVNILNKNKVALKWKQNDFALWVNGIEVGTDTSGVPPINLSLLRFEDGADNGQYFYGNVKEIKIYNTVLTDQELASLTS